MSVESGTYKGNYSAGTRFGTDKGTNPEELIGAANAGCFSMAFSLMLEQAGYLAESIDTDAAVTIDKSGEGFRITKVGQVAIRRQHGAAIAEELADAWVLGRVEAFETEEARRRSVSAEDVRRVARAALDPDRRAEFVVRGVGGGR